jgi:hypothetical protein
MRNSPAPIALVISTSRAALTSTGSPAARAAAMAASASVASTW